MKWSNLFGFEHMITPWLIRFLYIIAVVLIILGGLAGICIDTIDGISNGDFVTVILALIGYPIGIVVAVLLVRIYAELLMLAFRIYESLHSIERMMRERRAE